MKYILITTSFILIFLSNCRTVQEIDFYSRGNNSFSQLPALEATVDFDNLSKKISYGNIKVSGYYNATIRVTEPTDVDTVDLLIEDSEFNRGVHIENPEYYQTKATFVPEIRVYDIIKLFSKEVYGNDNKIDTSYLGSIDLELVSFKQKRSFVLSVLSIWTLCVPSLVGVPINNIKTNLELKITIYNKDFQEIKSYTSKGKGNAFVAMYWGYGEDVRRKSLINAFHNTFEIIKKQIEVDIEFINLKLIE